MNNHAHSKPLVLELVFKIVRKKIEIVFILFFYQGIHRSGRHWGKISIGFGRVHIVPGEVLGGDADVWELYRTVLRPYCVSVPF